jgi:GAF domain-containing protein
MGNSIPEQKNTLSQQLRLLVQSIEAAGHSFLPSTDQELLKSIVEAAARIFGAAAASIALVDEAHQELVFRVAYGAGQEDLPGMRIPLDQGIAGYVAMTGQPIAVSNVQHDPRFNQSFAKSTCYVPRSILATPLISGERVTGVMEVLDKISAPAFGLQDMELLSIFAKQAAIAIQQSQQFNQIDVALIDGMKAIAGGESSELRASLDQAGQDLVKETLEGSDLRELAQLIYEFSQGDDAGRQFCIQVLQAFRDYRTSRPKFH